MKQTSRATITTFAAVCSLACASVAGAQLQQTPPPKDPREAVIHAPRLLKKPADRQAAIALLDRARENSDLHELTTPYVLRASFDTSGTTQLEGQGNVQELSDGAGHWSWIAQLQNRIVHMLILEGHVFANPTEQLPLRLQTVHSALANPVIMPQNDETLRELTLVKDGNEIKCVLASGYVVAGSPPRTWFETENCVATATGRLQSWSVAPGMYAECDYTGSTDFHGHTLPRQISIYENGKLVVTIHLDELDDSTNLDAGIFEVKPGMVEVSAPSALGIVDRIWTRIVPAGAPPSPVYQPVLVHAILDARDGTVLDAELLENTYPQMNRAALDLLNTIAFPPVGFQHEVYITVQFHFSIEHLGSAMLHPGGPWMVSDRMARIVAKRPRPAQPVVN